MPAFAMRFVSQEALPPRLSEFDREQFFTLTSADVAAIREQFRSDHRLPAALMLMFMRVAGRPLDGFSVLSRNLLRHTAQILAASPPAVDLQAPADPFQAPVLGQDPPGPART